MSLLLFSRPYSSGKRHCLPRTSLFPFLCRQNLSLSKPSYTSSLLLKIVSKIEFRLRNSCAEHDCVAIITFRASAHPRGAFFVPKEQKSLRPAKDEGKLRYTTSCSILKESPIYMCPYLRWDSVSAYSVALSDCNSRVIFTI